MVYIIVPPRSLALNAADIEATRGIGCGEAHDSTPNLSRFEQYGTDFAGDLAVGALAFGRTNSVSATSAGYVRLWHLSAQ